MTFAYSTARTSTLALTAHEARLLFRSNQYTGYTSSFAKGHVQASLGIVPEEYALEFATYCHRNSKACPLIAIGNVGDPYLPFLGQDLDIRTDVPRYRVFQFGEVVEEPNDITHLWRDDLVAFVWGCSFSFEGALIEAGVKLRVQGDKVVTYETNIDTHSVGPFSGKLIVTMRPLIHEHVDVAVQVTSRFPSVHGAPSHVGAPELIGIDDLDRPLLTGRPPHVTSDETPVFWACGVTPRVALERARLPFHITHRPGSMVISDQLNSSLII